VLAGDITSLIVIHLLPVLLEVRRMGSFLWLGLFRN